MQDLLLRNWLNMFGALESKINFCTFRSDISLRVKKDRVELCMCLLIKEKLLTLFRWIILILYLKSNSGIFFEIFVSKMEKCSVWDKTVKIKIYISSRLFHQSSFIQSWMLMRIWFSCMLTTQEIPVKAQFSHQTKVASFSQNRLKIIFIQTVMTSPILSESNL